MWRRYGKSGNWVVRSSESWSGIKVLVSMGLVLNAPFLFERERTGLADWCLCEGEIMRRFKEKSKDGDNRES